MEHNSKSPNIAILGAGFSGICAAIQLEKQLQITNFTIFDENSNYGGTWLANTYPNCACDVQSHLYSFSFELNPDWTKNYPCQQEIHDYILKVAKKYKLLSRTKFCTQVKSMEWTDTKSQWKLSVVDKNSNLVQDLNFDFVINAVGRLRAPYIPEEFTNFKGPLIHSARWNHDIDLQNKIVAVVGSGASGIQIIPSIAPVVKELHCYQRRPAWISPRTQFEFPRFYKWIFVTFPIFMFLFRSLIFLVNEIHFNVFKANSIFNRLGTLKLTRFRQSHFGGNQILQNKLMPNYKLGCKRILLSNEYYKTFNIPHVHLHREPIENVKGKKIRMTNGMSQEVDILILATGFRVQEYFSPLKIIGVNKTELVSSWKTDGPKSYYGIMSNDTPNLFFVAGPNSGLGHNSAIFMIECQVNFALKIVREVMKRNGKSVRVRKSVQDAWMTRIQNGMKSTIWGTENCGSWYANSDGIVTALWPFSAISYYRETKIIDCRTMEFNF